MADEEIRRVLNEVAVAAVEGARAEALATVAWLLDSAPAAGLDRLPLSMTTAEAIAFGRLLSGGWDAANAANAGRIESQKAALAKILAALINAGVASLMIADAD